jgi:hypothetical protein
MKKEIVLSLLLVAMTVTAAGKKLDIPAAGQPVTLTWEQLIPADELAARANPAPINHSKGLGRRSGDEISSEDVFNALEEGMQSEIHNPVKIWNNRQVRIAGYIVPIDVNKKGDITSILLVPYRGACIHVPPPPPNQIIFVHLTTPFPMPTIDNPLWVTGILKTEKMPTDIAEAQYTMYRAQIEPYTKWSLSAL